MNRNSLLGMFFLTLLFFETSFCQKQTVVSAELQVYPTGLLPGLGADFQISPKAFLHTRLGANIFDHRDLGVQDEEKGDGFGFSIGYRRFFGDSQSAWRWAIKTDYWFNNVDWKSTDVNGTLMTGKTKIRVLQPTAELSYVFDFKEYILAPSIAFGAEWNVFTEGEPTGQGAILLLGIQLGKKL